MSDVSAKSARIGLRDLVTSLSSHLTLVADELKALKSSKPDASSGASNGQISYASVLAPDAHGDTRIATTTSKSSSGHSDDRKYNLLIFGLK